MKAKRTIFDPNFDTTMQPGHETRFNSLDHLMGGAQIKPERPKFQMQLVDRRNLRAVFNSGQVIELLPSQLQRGK